MFQPRTKLGAGALLAATLLTGCSDLYLDRRESISLSAGDDVKANQVAEMVDPWPATSANHNIAFDGQKMQTAVERYRTNKVIRPVAPTTSSGQYESAAPAAAPPKP